MSRVFGGLGGVSDVLVARFNRDGGLIWSALLGGGGGDVGMALAMGDSDELYIAGSTGSPDFQRQLPDGGTASSPTLGLVDGFVARLDSSGTQLGWFVRLGGNNVDFVHNLLRTPDRQLYVIGDTTSTNIPNLKGVTDPTIRGEEGFITRLNALDRARPGAGERIPARSRARRLRRALRHGMHGPRVGGLPGCARRRVLVLLVSHRRRRRA